MTPHDNVVPRGVGGGTSDSAAGTPVPRSRDAAATRHAILVAAGELFASQGFRPTTVRAIAERAGVNQALLFRYFGSKEGLFSATVRERGLDLLTSGPPGELLSRALDVVLDPEPSRAAEPFLAVLRGVGGSQATDGLGAELGAKFVAAFAAQVDTQDHVDASIRAGILLAWLVGLTITRTAAPPGSEAPPAVVKAHMLTAAAALLGPPARS